MIKRRKVEVASLVGLLLLGAIGMIFVAPPIASEEATATEAVHFSKLIESLPEAPSGWEGEDPAGSTLTSDEGTWSMATKSYWKTGAEDVTADVVITDYAFYTVGWSATWQGFVTYEGTEGYAKTTKVNGYPAWEVYGKASNNYALYVGINDRFMVVVTTNSDQETLYEFADAINYKGIAALGGTVVSPTSTESPQPSEEPETEGEEEETPGFEGVFVVVGLLVVMSLLRRRE